MHWQGSQAHEMHGWGYCLGWTEKCWVGSWKGRWLTKGAAVLPDVVGMLDEWVTGSAAAAAAAAAGAATHAMVAASWAAMGLAVVGSEEGPEDAGAGMAGSVGAEGSRAGSVGAAVDGSVVTWGAAEWVGAGRGAIAGAAAADAAASPVVGLGAAAGGRLTLELRRRGYGCCGAAGAFTTSPGLYFLSSPSSSVHRSTLPRQNGRSCLCLSCVWM